jgi:putative transposase
VSTRDIESHIRELYGVEMSEATVSHITDRIVEHVEARKSRRLERAYLVVCVDAIVFKVRQDGKVIDKAVQIAVTASVFLFQHFGGMANPVFKKMRCTPSWNH